MSLGWRPSAAGCAYRCRDCHGGFHRLVVRQREIAVANTEAGEVARQIGQLIGDEMHDLALAPDSVTKTGGEPRVSLLHRYERAK